MPKLQSSHCSEAMDEINIFWIRHIEVIQLYLKAFFPGKDSYVFTAATYMGFDNQEHLPFLLIGKKHVFDDPLSKYSEICNKMSAGKDADFLYKQVGITAADNIKLLENTKNNIFILPLRLLNKSNTHNSFYGVGEQAFASLFNGITGFKDYFKKCNSIQDIMRYAREDIGKLVMFSEEDDKSLPFEERFRAALVNTEFMVDENMPDSDNFFILVFGCIQQAIDVIVSCVEYGCIPYIRYPVAFHYISLLSESMLDIEHVTMLRFKMGIAFVVYQLCDKHKMQNVSLNKFLKINSEYDFNEKIFSTLKQNGITEKNFTDHAIKQLVIDELEKFYKQLSG